MLSTGCTIVSQASIYIYMQTYAGFMENGDEGIFVYATRNPTGEVLSVLLEFHVAVAIARIRMNYRKIFWLVIAWRWGGYTFGHGGGRQSRTPTRGRVGFVVGFVEFLRRGIDRR